jgi:hypothetical protein
MQNQLRISKGNLDGRRWTTQEQTAWLEKQIPVFTNAQGGPLRVRSAFWVKVYQDWVAHWPVEAAPPSLDSPADAAEISTAGEEHTDAARVLKMVCAYATTTALSLQI